MDTLEKILIAYLILINISAFLSMYIDKKKAINTNGVFQRKLYFYLHL